MGDGTEDAGRDNCSQEMDPLETAQQAWRQVLHGKTTQSDRSVLTRTDARWNSYWGDECKDKEGNIFRIYAQNVNGISLDRRGGQYDTLCQLIREVQVDVFLGQEHNLDSSQYQVRSTLHDTSKQHWQRYRLNIATTPIAFKAAYKPGGTFMLAVGNGTGRIISQDQDKWGRWVSQTFQGMAGRTITMVSAYQVVTDTVKGGTTTATTQQYSLLVNEQDSLLAPRAAFRRDLKNFLTQRRNQGEELILVGDFNEDMEEDASGVLSIVHQLNMVDMMGARHQQDLPATYSRGRKCLDYGFATPTVCAALVSCGFEGFGHRFPSDHRGYFFDFDIHRLFGTHIQPLSKVEPRLLHSTNARQATVYLRKLHAVLTSCNAYARGDRLASPGTRHRFAERLDSDILNASLVSEREIPYFPAPHWSKALMTARNQLSTLQKVMSCLRHGRSCPAWLTEQHVMNFPTGTPPKTRAECTQQISEAKIRVATIVKDSFAQRDVEFRIRIEELEKSGKPKDRKHAVVLRQMNEKERKRQMFRKLKSLRNQRGATGVSRIEIPVQDDQDPKHCTNWQTIDIPSEVLRHLQKRNRQHFGQANGTPFTRPPLSDDFGFCADTLEAQALLDGDYEFSDHEQPEVQLLLQHLKKLQPLVDHATPSTITEEECRSKLRVWRESTSTSPSGQHLGHFKTLLARHDYSDVTEEDTPADIQKRDELDAIQTKILRLRLQIVNYALRTGHSYKRWQTIANSHLLKEPGNIKIHRTRVIHIYEADYNLALGVKWRQAMHRAQDAGVLNEGQYGSRPHRKAQDPVLLEELQLELSRVSRKTLVQTSYDAASCYDRIPPSLAMMASRKYGMDITVTFVNAKTLEKAQYRIRTDLGLASTGYTHTIAFPIFGTGQGSANSPTIWCFISCTLFDCYDQKANPAHYCSPEGKNPVTLGMIGFVDDTNGQTNDFGNDEQEDTWKRVLRQAQENAQLWTNLLNASGGALELSKCSYHLLRWSFSISGAPVLTVPQNVPSMEVRNPQDLKDYQIPMLCPYTSHKTLGHYKEPSGSQKEQFKQLRKLCNDQVAFLWKSPLSRVEAWYFYQACFLPSVSYPLPNSHFTMAELQAVQRTAMGIVVAKCGFNRHTKREVLYGPMSLGGAEFRELYDEQGIGQVTTFLRHWRERQVIGNMLRNLVAWTNYSAGTSVSILADVHTPLPHLEAQWLGSLRVYLSHTRACIEVDDDGIAPVEREHDDYIMDLILDSQQFQPPQIRVLNYCRLYLGAVTLSDLTHPDGLYLDNAKLHGHSTRMSNETQWLKINQGRPSDTQWKLWRKANRLWSTPKGRLFQPLGRWLRCNDARRIRCFAYVEGHQLSLRTQGGFQTYEIDDNGRQVGEGNLQGIRYVDLHPEAHPAEVYEAPDGRWTVRTTTTVLEPERVPESTTFYQYTQALDPWEADLLQQVRLAVDPAYLSFDLQLYFFAGTDGSVKHGTNGSFGWSLSNPEGDRVATAMGPARGASMDSYRAECTGMLSLLRFLVRVAGYTNQEFPWRGLIGTDSQSMLDRVYDSGGQEGTRKLAVLDVLDPEWDLLVEIQDALQELPGVSLTYVKGHQDDRAPYERLPLVAQLNVDADRLAAQYHNDHGARRPFALMAPHTGAILVTDDRTLTSKFQEELRYRSTGPGLEDHLRIINSWSQSTFEAVNWVAHGKAMRARKMRRVHLTKYLHDALPTYHKLNKMDDGKRTCIGCGTCDETSDHILRCEAPSMTTWRTKWWEKIDAFHLEHGTHPLLRHVFREAMQQWWQSDTPDDVSSVLFPVEVRRLISNNKTPSVGDTFFADVLRASGNGSKMSTTSGMSGKRLTSGRGKFGRRR